MNWKNPRDCARCGSNFVPKWHGLNRFCSRHCSGSARKKTGADNPNWKGGRTCRADGRTLVYDSTRHSPNGSRSYTLEYRLIAERKLGRKLRVGEVVHHINGDQSDNRPENLEVMTQSEHAREHAAERRDPDTGRFK